MAWTKPCTRLVVQGAHSSPSAALGSTHSSGLILDKLLFTLTLVPQHPLRLSIQVASMLREAARMWRQGALDLESEDLTVTQP